MQLIYEQLLGGEGGPDTLRDLIAFVPENAEDQEYIDRLVQGVSAQAAELDREIAGRSPSRELGRIPRVVLAILRLSLCELRLMPDTPPSVIINEAVELAKRYGEEGDSRFVNGVLGNVVRQQAEK